MELQTLLGKKVTLFCLNYIYTGELTSVNDVYVVLKDAKLVFETGSFSDRNWSNAEAFPKPVHVMLRCVEAFMEFK